MDLGINGKTAFILQPSAASARAIPAPIPCDAPNTRAIPLSYIS